MHLTNAPVDFNWRQSSDKRVFALLLLLPPLLLLPLRLLLPLLLLPLLLPPLLLLPLLLLPPPSAFTCGYKELTASPTNQSTNCS